MGFLSETPVVCQRCRKTFMCGCVIVNVCPACNAAECVHDFISLIAPPEAGSCAVRVVTYCRKCYQRKPAQ